MGDRGDAPLLGGAGNAALTGGAGADWLNGGDGADTVTGGDGADTFVVSLDREAPADLTGDSLLITDFDTTGSNADVLRIELDSEDETSDLRQITVNGGRDVAVVLDLPGGATHTVAVIQNGVANGFVLADHAVMVTPPVALSSTT
jgi:Ca2+-binding RTX toxin-like protein